MSRVGLGGFVNLLTHTRPNPFKKHFGIPSTPKTNPTHQVGLDWIVSVLAD